MSQIGFEQAAADHGIDLAALKTLVPGAKAVGVGKVAVTPQADIANLAGAPTQADFNGLLTKLRAAGVLIAA